MFDILWKNGAKGKLWRLARSLNVSLTARVKTKHGITRKITRGGGGKQGGQIIVTLFSKLMDTLTDDMQEDDEMGVKIENEKIANLLFVDDVATLAEGKKHQEKTLEKVHEFALKHKVKWGAHKCNVLEIGKHRCVKEKWRLGDEEIMNSDTYRYLGDIINRNGSNKQNLEERFKKVKNSTREVMACGNSEIMRTTELKVCLDLHEAVTVPMMINNCESWVLTSTDTKELEKMELWALKRILNIPTTTPSTAVRFVTCTLFMQIRVDLRQLIYMQKILKRERSHWTHHILLSLDQHDLGWSRQIREKLRDYGLEQNWDAIAKMTDNEWKVAVKEAGEKKNIEKLKSECWSTRNGTGKEKTKSKPILNQLNDDNYRRTNDVTLMKMNKLKAKAIIMLRYGMLDCAANYENKYKSKKCNNCHTLDDVSHRINFCEKWKQINFFDSEIKIDLE